MQCRLQLSDFERNEIMVILDDLRVEMVNYRKEMIELSDVLNLKESEKELEDLKKQIAADGFWDDLENSQKILQKTKTIENKIGAYNKLNENLEDIIALIELSIEAEEFFYELGERDIQIMKNGRQIN